MPLDRAKINELYRIHTQVKTKQLLKLSFSEWLPIRFPNFRWDWNYIKYMLPYIEAWIRGDIRFLLIMLPPRHGKTELFTIRVPAYICEAMLNKNICVACYNQDTAEHFSRPTRSIIAEDGFLKTNRLDEWRTITNCLYKAVGVDSGVTGRGFHYLLFDDPIKSAKEASSETERETLWQAFLMDFFTRLEPHSVMGVILTHWHHDDIASRILNSSIAKEFTVVNIPAIAKENDVLGRPANPLYEMIPESALCPDRYPIDKLLQIRNLLGNFFEALYQQNPTLEGGNVINTKDIVEYVDKPKYRYIVQSYDTSFKDKDTNDFTVGFTWGVGDGRFDLIDRIKGRMTYPQLIKAMTDWAFYHKADTIVIEDKASGQSAIQTLRLVPELDGKVVAFSVDTDKVSRASACTDVIRNSKVAMPKYCDWKQDFIKNLSEFPMGEHDDDVDAFTVGLLYLVNRFTSIFAVFPEFNYNLHVVDQVNLKYPFTKILVGIYLDVMATCVIVGVNEIGQFIVLAEVTSCYSLEHLLIILDGIFNKNNWNVKKEWSIWNTRIDTNWYQVVQKRNIEMAEYYKPVEEEMISYVKENLSQLTQGMPKLQIIGDNCKHLREGFEGAYGYTERASMTNDFVHKIPENIFLKVHRALQISIYNYIFARS